MRTIRAFGFLLLTCTVGWSPGLSAHEADETAPPGPVEPRSDRDGSVEFTDPGNWVLGSTFGAGSAGGQYGDFLERPLNFDLNLGYEPGHGPWRFGIGLQFGSMDMKAPYDTEKEWARFDTYFFATRIFNKEGTVGPYLQGRLGIARIHPRSELFYFDEPENLEPGASGPTGSPR